MRYFDLMDFQYWILAVFLGVIAVILVCMAWGGYPLQHREPAADLEEVLDLDIETAEKVKKNPIVPFLIVVYVMSVLWALAYMVFMGMFGTSI